MVYINTITQLQIIQHFDPIHLYIEERISLIQGGALFFIGKFQNPKLWTANYRLSTD